MNPNAPIPNLPEPGRVKWKDPPPPYPVVTIPVIDLVNTPKRSRKTPLFL
jgi:hypothetical protein